MNLVNNLDVVSKLCTWQPNTYYKFIALSRKKDGDSVVKDKCRKEAIVKTWLVESQEYFDSIKDEMLGVVDRLNCRLYMTVDRKSVVKTLVQARAYVDTQLDLALFSKADKVDFSVKSLNKMMNSITSLKESSDNQCKKWLFDVDAKDAETVAKVEKICGEFLLATIETKNGFHVIAERKFDANGALNKEPLEYVEIKTNALVLLAFKGDK